MTMVHSQTHCQATQAKAQTQAWHRMFLSNRTTKTTNKPEDEKEHQIDNNRFTKKRVQWLMEHITSHQLL